MITSTPFSHTDRLAVSGINTSYDRMGYSNFLLHKLGRANSIAAIRPRRVHAEQLLEINPFEPCRKLSHTRTMGNSQMQICCSMSSLNVRDGLIDCNRCHFLRHNNGCLLPEMSTSEVVTLHNMKCRCQCQAVNKHMISQSAMTLCPVDLHSLGARYSTENSDSYKPGSDPQSNKGADNAGHQPAQSVLNTGSSERYRRYIRNRNPRILYVNSKHKGTWV